MLAYELQRIYQAELNAKISYKKNRKDRYKTKPTDRQKQVLEVVKDIGAGKSQDIQKALGDKTPPYVVLKPLVEKGFIQLDNDSHVYYTSLDALNRYLNDSADVSLLIKCQQYAKKAGVFHISELQQFTSSPSTVVHRMKVKGQVERVCVGRWKWIDETH